MVNRWNLDFLGRVMNAGYACACTTTRQPLTWGRGQTLRAHGVWWDGKGKLSTTRGGAGSVSKESRAKCSLSRHGEAARAACSCTHRCGLVPDHLLAVLHGLAVHRRLHISAQHC